METLDPWVLDAVAAPVIVLHRNACVVFWNSAYSAIVDHAGSEAAGRDVREFLDPASGARLTNGITSLSPSDPSTILELDWVTRAGGTTGLTLELRLGSPSSGGPVYVVATVISLQQQPVFDLAPFGILLLEPDGAISFNHRLEEILGVQLDSEGGVEQCLALIRRLDAASPAPDELPSSRAPCHGELVAVEELLVRRSDGTEARILTRADPIHGPKGGAIRNVVLFEDVTERMMLRASYTACAGIVSLASEAIIVIDREQRIVLFNEGAARVFGWSAREVIGQPIDLLIPQRLRARHRTAVEAFARGSVKARRMAEGLRIVAGLRRNGEEFPSEAGISKIGLGGSMHLAVVLRDISERKRQENEQRFLAHAGATLASSLDYQETLTTVARLAVPLLADCCIVELLDGTVRRLKVVHVDPTKAQWAADFEAMHILEPKSHPIWQALEERRSVLLTEFPPGYLEQVAQTPAHLRLLQELSPVSLISVPLVARSRVLGALSFVSVRREHVYGEGELRLAEELARRAALAVENSQLYTISQRAVRARDEILGVVAHDLRNPLGVIKLVSETLLRKFEDSQDIRRLAQNISRAVERASRLIQDLLDVTRVEGGGLAMERAPCRPSDLLHEALVMMQPAAESAVIELAVAAQPDLPMIEADRDRILQVFSNLVGNAIKFTPRGGRVRLTAFRRGQHVCFSVADTGPGITAEQLPHLFDRFWQAQPTDCRGAGLGLAIAKGIVEAHGGRIWVESRPGEGSTFFFTVPELGADARVRSAPSRPRRASRSHRKMPRVALPIMGRGPCF